MLDVPRSARLAAWGGAVATARVPADAALRAVQRDDEPHTLTWTDGAPALPGDGPVVHDLRGLLHHLPRGARLLVVLPAPGDPVGLPGPAAVNAAALEAGECVVVELPGTPERWALVPAVTTFGSLWEPGATVEWTVHGALPRRAPDPDALADAERELRTALTTVTRTLAGLDVARWREDAAQRIADLRSPALPRDALPPGTEARSVRVVQSAVQVLGIAQLAAEDDGASISGHEAATRARALREIAGTARRALAVAVNCGQGASAV
ncbi:hypothetical protein NUM3379_03380 [Kineococcus sp. NUM-3379]